MELRRLCKGVGLSLSFCLLLTGKTLAADEILLENVLKEDTQKPTIDYNLGNYDVRDYSIPTQINSLSYSSNEAFRLAQAVTPTIKIDAGVQKTEPSATTKEQSVEADAIKTEAEEYSEATFIDRIVKENQRPKALQIFNKNGYQFEEGPVKSVRVGFFYFGADTIFWPYNDSLSSKWKDGAAELSVITKFRNNKTSLRVSYNFLRDLTDHPSKFMEKFSEIGLVHEFNKNQQVHVGQTWRLPIGVEGYVTTYNQDLPTRAMIGRNFGNTRSFGVRNVGNYKYMDYDIGVYDSTRYWAKFGNGLDFTGWLNFKPMANLDSDKYGKLTVGTGLSAGRNNEPYSIWGAYVGYDYKRFHNKFEYAYANGYNAGVQSTNKCEGFYNTMLFDLTKKLKLIARYDYYNPNIIKSNGMIAEYTGGLSYELRKNLKLVAAYTYKNVTNGTYSNIVSLQARVKI